MRKLAAAVAFAFAIAPALAGQATAQSATVCADATVVVNGETVVDEHHCQTLPPPG